MLVFMCALCLLTHLEQIALAEETKDAKPDSIQDKSSLDDDDLLKQESNQDLSEQKQLYQQLHQVLKTEITLDQLRVAAINSDCRNQ